MKKVLLGFFTMKGRFSGWLRSITPRYKACSFLYAVVLMIFSTSTYANTFIHIKELTSSKGFVCWFVANHENPIVSVGLSFKNAGSKADPKEGLSKLLSGLLDEGAGPYNSYEFKKKLIEKNIELKVRQNRDSFDITFRTTKENIKDAFELIKFALTQPRFDEVPLKRIKHQLHIILQKDLVDEREIAQDTLEQKVFKEHPYNQPLQRQLQRLESLTKQDLLSFMKDRFTKDQLILAVAGDIDEKELCLLLDDTFEGLNDQAVPLNIPEVTLHNMGSTYYTELNIPQSCILFIQPAVKRHNPDFYAFFVLNKILGDGQFKSRLWNEIREKRGLAYYLDTDLLWFDHSELIVGITGTKNQSVEEVIRLIREEWQKVKEHGCTQEELDFVKKRMIGSFALNFSSTKDIVAALLLYQRDHLGTEHVNKRNEIIASITLQDIQRVIDKYIRPEQLTFVVAGGKA